MSAWLTAVEVCAGAGGMALGIHRAGFQHRLLVENDRDAADTLCFNAGRLRLLPRRIACCDLRETQAVLDVLRHGDSRPWTAVDLFAGGVPCQPFSVAGRKHGAADERDMFPPAIRLAGKLKARAVMFENVPGLLSPRFERYRKMLDGLLAEAGYPVCGYYQFRAWQVGVPQDRSRVFLVAFRSRRAFGKFQASMEQEMKNRPKPESLADSSASWATSLWHAGLFQTNGWNPHLFIENTRGPCPLIQGGSKKHGGADLGSRGTKWRWRLQNVDGSSIADDAPRLNTPLEGPIRLTLPMLAVLQGFPTDWKFQGKKTSVFRQIGNALPPAMAEFVGRQVRLALEE